MLTLPNNKPHSLMQIIESEYFKKAKEYINRLDNYRAERELKQPSHPPGGK